MFCKNLTALYKNLNLPRLQTYCKKHRNIWHHNQIGPSVATVDFTVVEFSTSCLALRRNSSDVHGVYEADEEGEGEHSGKSVHEQNSHNIELQPSRLIRTRVTTPVNPYVPKNWTPEKSDKGQIRWDQRHLKEQSYNRRDIEYNFGLPGLGKQFPGKRDGKSYHRTFETKGEIMFGLFPVLLALQQKKRECHTLYVKKSLTTNPRPLVAEIMKLTEESGAEICPCSVTKLNTMSRSRPHQGVCMDVSQISYMPFEQIEGISSTEYNENEETSRHQVWVVLNSIQDPMNFGAVLRTAYFLGVDKLLATAKNSCALSPVVSKASAGALELMPIYSVQNVEKFLSNQRECGWHIVGTASRQASQNEPDDRHLPLHLLTVRANTIMLLGNEGQGLSSELLQLCDSIVTISPGSPSINPNLDSLNVSVATGIILHHVMSRR